MEHTYCEIGDTHAYKSIVQYYGDECAKRSGVPKINHITEGLLILDKLNANFVTKCAYCIHPLIQMDDDLIANRQLMSFSADTIVLAMEYRNKANAFLCRPETDHYTLKDMPTLPLVEVKQMLIADKIQNKKDFMIHHYGTHQRSDELFTYFNKWLEYLGVDDVIYEHTRYMNIQGN